MKKNKKLIHNNKIILNEMRYSTNIFDISKGLMFKGRKTVEKGLCMVLPSSKDVKFGASITMLFCFVDMQIIFINSEFKVVDKKNLKTWTSNYTPKKPCKYIIESTIGKFDKIKIGDLVSIK